MFDIKWIRDNPEAFDAGLAKRGLAPQSVELIALDEARRAVVTKLQEAQARRNAASKEIGKAKGTLEQARKALHKEMKRKGKRKFKRLPSGDIVCNAIRGEVWESQRGKIVGERAVYVGAEGYGEPGPARRTRRRATEE